MLAWDAIQHVKPLVPYASGTYANVFKACHGDVDVAIKVQKPAFQGSRQGVETLRKDKEMRTAAWNGINTLQSLHHHNIVSVLAVVVVPLTKMPALVMRWYPHTRTSTHHTVGGGHRQDQGAVGGRRAASASMAAPLDSTAQAHTHSKHWAAAAPHQGPIPTRT